jgi:hypothetical protein
MVLRRSNNNFGITTNPKFDMCQNKKRYTSEEQEKYNLFLHKNMSKKKKKMIMEIFLPYTSC